MAILEALICPRLFLILHLHQTTTLKYSIASPLRCFLSCIYIKPQPTMQSLFSLSVVSYLASTSNHNRSSRCHNYHPVVSYLASTSNHNPKGGLAIIASVVSYLASTSNHNCKEKLNKQQTVVSYLASTSNHNYRHLTLNEVQVVSYLASTSNHNMFKLRKFPTCCFLSCIYIKPQLPAPSI